jgi:hypothetical protein
MRGSRLIFSNPELPRATLLTIRPAAPAAPAEMLDELYEVRSDQKKVAW